MVLYKMPRKAIDEAYIEHIRDCTYCSEEEAKELFATAVQRMSADDNNIQYAVAMVIAKNIKGVFAHEYNR